MNTYIIFAILYAVLIGVYNVLKKKATTKSSETVILVMYTFVCFCLSMIWIPFGVKIPLKFVGILAGKGFLLAFSWYCTLKVMKDADVSLVSLTTVLSTVMTFIIGIVGFGEGAGWLRVVGSVLIVGGAVLINLVDRKEKGKTNIKHLLMLLASAIITSISNVVDKYTTTYLDNRQVQFWFLLFAFVFSAIFFAIECIRSKKFLIGKEDLKNYWIYLVGAFLFVGDMFLFLSYKSPGSQMIVISVIAKLKTVVTVLLGILWFKEKDAWKKILISLLIVTGVILVAL